MTPDPATLREIIMERSGHYGLDVDSRLRTAANRLTARAFHELLARLDDTSEDFVKGLDSVLADFPVYGPDILIGFDDGSTPSLLGTIQGEYANSIGTTYEPTLYWLKLVFTDEAACYYQFPLFPDLHQEAVISASRKRLANTQLLRIEFDRPGGLQTFTEKCRENPFLMYIAESSPEEFHAATSEAA